LSFFQKDILGGLNVGTGGGNQDADQAHATIGNTVLHSFTSSV
jgi:hypothetical protein